ncbi:hypothetical protein [Baekduia sp.]|jgi:hypothetical protein|uniref:hypothetical protein n=1 Tax=Baekduia sp. TaxID=2600305 RepID=UPI002E078C99|nr:hypothetical protein [Baekduia sp.]
MADPYLVLFVADAADDGHADALRDAARDVPNAGFFDGVGGAGSGDTRTVGAYLRTEELADGVALVTAVAEVSLALAARIEVQYREEILGHLVDGRPDEALQARLPLRDIPEPL